MSGGFVTPHSIAIDRSSIQDIMLATNIIAKKRDGGVLDESEIRFLVDGFVRGTSDKEERAAVGRKREAIIKERWITLFGLSHS